MKLSRKSGRLAALMLSATLVLAACQTSEERAQEHFESGLALLEQGDVARALVEFRNVFKLDPLHKDARLTYARAQMENEAFGDAYSQYLRVVEQFPDTFEARIELAEMAINARNWDEAERHGRAAADLDPGNPRTQIVVTALDYAKAFQDENPVAAADEALKARDLLEQNPDSLIARQVVIDQYLRSGDLDAAMAAVETGLEIHPDVFEMHATKLQIQANRQEVDAIGGTLRTMVDRFPANEDIRRMLIAYYIDREDLDSAEAYLRDLASAEDAGKDEKLTVVRFLRETKGLEAAREELERLVAAEEDTIAYRALLASVAFETGERKQAITDLETLLETTAAAEDPETQEDANSEVRQDRLRAKVVLARMLLETGNTVGARAQVEEILQDDPTNVDALKMRAAWLIDEDKPDGAILDLRTALSEQPRDADIMTLMASAHERAGSRDLAGERYAMAVEVSMQAPAESLRYAQYLVQEERQQAAKAVLTEALNRAPNNIDLLQNLATLHIQSEDWNEVTRLVWRLRALETERATAIANGLEADVMLRQERVDETIQFLEGLASEDGSSSEAALAALIQTKVRAGQIDDARGLVERRLAETPDSRILRYLRAGLHMVDGDRDAASEIYATLLDEVPGHPRVMRTLFAIMMAEGRQDEARAMIDDQIETAPEPIAALLLKAEMLERDKDFEGAIAIYEDLYAQNSNNVLVANNLASLITTHRDSAEDLDRAYSIARRLSSAEIPALQDTYGWIEYRRGNYEEALKYLEPAAEGLPQHALVQYHLGMTYHALNRTPEARETLTRALELAGDEPLPQFDRAREGLEGMGNE